MPYLTLQEYPRKWIFTHQALPINEVDLQQINPFTASRSAHLWIENISKLSPDADRFSREDWPCAKSTWSDECDWSQAWESDDSGLPDAILQHIDWQDDVTVYFCYEKYNVIETKWSVFKKHWKNFLFFDDGPILIARRRKQALWFHSNGKVQLGTRSDNA